MSSFRRRCHLDRVCVPNNERTNERPRSASRKTCGSFRLHPIPLSPSASPPPFSFLRHRRRRPFLSPWSRRRRRRRARCTTTSVRPSPGQSHSTSSFLGGPNHQERGRKERRRQWQSRPVMVRWKDTGEHEPPTDQPTHCLHLGRQKDELPKCHVQASNEPHWYGRGKIEV